MKPQVSGKTMYTAIILLLTTLAFLVATKLTSMRNLEHLFEKQDYTSLSKVYQPLAQTALLTGIYTGTIALTEPVALGVMDFVVDIVDKSGVLTGTVNVSQTQAFPGSPVPRTVSRQPLASAPTSSAASFPDVKLCAVLRWRVRCSNGAKCYRALIAK